MSRIGGKTPFTDEHQKYIQDILENGKFYVAEEADLEQQNSPVACIPLKIQQEVLGVIILDKLMVQKFVTWKTNKQDLDDRFPAFVMHYTDFSSGRKDPLKREIRISNDPEQIMELTKAHIEKKIKKGWEKVK